MADVAVLFKVYTDQGNEDAVKNAISEQLKPKGVQIDDIAFGIKIIKVLFVHSDAEGSTVLEEKLRAIKGVNEVEVADESLV